MDLEVLETAERKRRFAEQESSDESEDNERKYKSAVVPKTQTRKHLKIEKKRRSSESEESSSENSSDTSLDKYEKIKKQMQFKK